jgi:4-hydroxy-4-methyl-2-oxoglutarate aldolase
MTAATIYDEIARAGAATVYEAYGRRGDLDPAIRRISSSRPIAGPAYCVVCEKGDNLALHRAVAKASPGDILVVAGHQATYGYLGDILAEAALARGIAGVIVDGFVRDSGELRSLNFPVWARGLAIRGATKTAPGDIEIAIDCGGVRIAPGDLVIADDDGIAAVRASDLEAMMLAMRKRLDQENEIREKLRQGALTLDLLDLRKYVTV